MTEQDRLARLEQQLSLEDAEDFRHKAVSADISDKSRAELEEDLNENKWKRLYELVPTALDTFEEILMNENASTNDRRQVAESVLDRAGLAKKREVVVEETGINAQTLIEAFAGMAKMFGSTQRGVNPALGQDEAVEGSFEEGS